MGLYRGYGATRAAAGRRLSPEAMKRLYGSRVPAKAAKRAVKDVLKIELKPGQNPFGGGQVAAKRVEDIQRARRNFAKFIDDKKLAGHYTAADLAYAKGRQAGQ